MTNVSKRSIKRVVRKRIQHQFFSIISSLKKPGQAENFVEDFLTDSEEMMLYKRLAIIFMLSKNLSQSVISRTLKVSRGTVSRVFKVLDRGGYDSILKVMGKKRRDNDFVVDMEVLLRMGLPPIVGKGRCFGRGLI